MIATDVTYQVNLSRFLKFKKQNKKELSMNHSTLYKNLGNLKAGTKEHFKYDIKSHQKYLGLTSDSDCLKDQKFLLFQVIVSYTDL